MKEKEYDKWLITGAIKVLLIVFSWIMLFLAVIYAGFTIGLLIMWIVKGADITNNIVAFMMQFIGGYTGTEIDELIAANGMSKVIIGGLGYGFTMSFTFSLGHMLIGKFSKLFDTIVSGDMFTKKNVDSIEDALPLSILFALTQPVLVFVINTTTGMYDLDDATVAGLSFVFVNYVLKLIFEKGYALNRSENKLDRLTNDVKAKEEEYSVELLKKENEIKTLKGELKAIKTEFDELEEKNETLVKQKEAIKVKANEAKKKVAAPKKVEKKQPKADKKQPTKKAPAKVNKPHKKIIPKKTTKKETPKTTK